MSDMLRLARPQAPGKFAVAAPRRAQRVRLACCTILALSLATSPARSTPAGYEYVSPEPGSRMVSPANAIAIREGRAIDERTLGAGAIAVTGSVSGSHAGTLSVSDDASTIIFEPDAPFAPGESVTVGLADAIRTRDGSSLPALSFDFTIAAAGAAAPGGHSLGGVELDDTPNPGEVPPESPPDETPGDSTTASSGNRLPPTFPRIMLMAEDQPPPGDLFLTPFSAAPSDSGHLVIVDNAAQPLLYRRLPTPPIDFKLQPNGLLTYFTRSPRDGGAPRFYALDSTYAIVDSFAMGNGYVTDSHELQLLPNGHALLLAYDPQPVRMDSVVAGGNPNAIVSGAIVQELDRKKHVVFQWRSWDHFAITDCVSPGVDLKGANIDYVHANAIQPGHGNTLLLSCRHMDEITKIDTRTGAILWRMGPHAKHNEWTFVNDPRGFSHQHDVRLLPNGHLTVFDNGDFLDPQYSRAVEYRLDGDDEGGWNRQVGIGDRRGREYSEGEEVGNRSPHARTATLVWEYRNVPDTYGSFMGNVQRHADGSTTICWGGSGFGPRVTELHADGTKDLELGMSYTEWTYRGLRFPWRTTRIAAPESLAFGAVDPGDSATLTLPVTNRSATSVEINDAYLARPEFALLTPLPVTLAPGESRDFAVRFAPTSAAPVRGTLYLKSLQRNELIAQDVTLSGQGASGVLDAAAALPAPGLRLYPCAPNPVHSIARLGFDVPGDARVTLDIFDVRGRRIARLVNSVLPPGHYERTWQPKRATGGAYFCRLRSRGRYTIEKIIVTG